jgi:sodium-coupled neutral amino acid transporter 11
MSNKSDFRGGVMNLINATVGAGIVAVPYAIMQCGFYSGVMLLLLLAYAIFESMIILITCGLKTKTKSLEDLCLYLFDEKGFYISAGFMFMYSYGSMVAILVVIGDIVPFCVSRLFGIDMALLDRNMVIVVVATVAILPLSLLRDLASLSAASLFSILSLVILVVFVVVFGYDISIANSTYAHVEDLHFMDSDIMKGIGTLSFHYVCQHSVLLVFHSLKNPTLHNWKSVASISMISVLAMSLVVGVAGGLLFAQSTKSNILNNFPQDREYLTCRRA